MKNKVLGLCPDLMKLNSPQLQRGSCPRKRALTVAERLTYYKVIFIHSPEPENDLTKIKLRLRNFKQMSPECGFEPVHRCCVFLLLIAFCLQQLKPAGEGYVK